MENTGNGEPEVKTAERPYTAESSTPYPKKGVKNTVKTKRVGRPKKGRLPPTKDEALSLLASALMFCVEAGIKLGAANIDTGSVVSLKDVSCSKNNGNLTFLYGITDIA